MTGHNGQIKSSVVIARLLESEGFSEETANAVRRYARRRSGFTDQQKRKWDARLKDFHKITAKLSAAEKLVLGKFIAVRQKASFDAGLRIGLMAFAQAHDKTFPDEDTLLSVEAGGK